MIQELVPIGDGCSLWTQATGAGEPMVLCHGGPGLWDYLRPLAQLAGPRWRVHRYDQRGCGRSGHRGEWTLDQFIADLDALRAHFGYQRWVVGGHSFGADLALRYALRYPHRVTAVVYICGTGLEWSTHSSAHKAAARARRSKREQDRLAALAAGPRTAAQEHEFLLSPLPATHSLSLSCSCKADKTRGRRPPATPSRTPFLLRPASCCRRLAISPGSKPPERPGRSCATSSRT